MVKKHNFTITKEFGKSSLYSFDNEHDACGVGLITTLNGEKSQEIVDQGLEVLENMLHRGAESSDNKTGDGAGIMVQVPHDFILSQGIKVPKEGEYGTGLIFFPKDKKDQETSISLLREVVKTEGLSLLKLRDVPVNSEVLGEISSACEPDIKQIFITGNCANEELEKKLFILRKKIEKKINEETSFIKDKQFYIVSISTNRLIYKGMLTSLQLRDYFSDLTHPKFTSRVALVHSRFSTNTLPTWDLAQPFRVIAHNGEINTIRGNRQRMISRESVFRSNSLGDMEALYPIVQPDMSDSASLDNVVEFLVRSGKTLPHTLSMLVPESFNDKNPISDEVRAFYEYHSVLMEPWDGPAAILFCDGRYAGGMLDRNGLRPARYTITKDNKLILASETGTIDLNGDNIKSRGRLNPGKMLLIDTYTGQIFSDKELKDELASAFPYREWLNKNCLILDNVSSGRHVNYKMNDLMKQLISFGYSLEDIERLIVPMALQGKEPTESMGNDVVLPAFSEKPQRLFNYFRQQFAQVTNPPIDPIREELIMSLTGYIGSIQQNLLEEIPELSKIVKIKSPILTNTEFEILKNLQYKGFNSVVLPIHFNASEGAKGLADSIDNLCQDVEKAIDEGKNYIILSDRGIDKDKAPIPSLLATSAVHLFLVEKRKRMQIDIVVESAEPREVMHFALLFSFGANAVNPYMVFAILNEKVANGDLKIDFNTAKRNYIKAVNKGLLKVLSKMGNSTLRSYRGAHIFEALGISSEVLDKYFHEVSSKIEGIDMEDIANEVITPLKEAYKERRNEPLRLQNLGNYAYRVEGSYHAWNPETISLVQQATREKNYDLFKQYVSKANDKPVPAFIRDLLDYKRKPIDISEVEPKENIMKRFCTGAMSYGSISREAHEAMAIAMNIIGGRSNTGEGGEDPLRFKKREDGLSARSAIKQVASGRFGVTSEYLVNADEIQIKIAQGAKPGEGGQLPGHKVDEIIAKTRHSIPGISLISPPPHHDIYSIEDLAQLIFDLKNVNPNAVISVKLVSESGVGTIAAGVAKAKADLIVISGAEGGTGASPASSIKHAGLPLEIGLAETQQTLVMNNLRGLVTIQADGQIKTGRDIVIAALMGAEEYGFATSALIVLGCVMMRKCQLNTCPVGIATQNKDLRKLFDGKVSNLVTFFEFLAEDVRENLAELGYKSLDEIIGRSDLLERKHYESFPKTEKIDLKRIMFFPKQAENNAIRKIKNQHHKIDNVIDRKLIERFSSSIYNKKQDNCEVRITNTDRAVGAMLSGEIAKIYGIEGLPDDTITIDFIGSAGQSFGAFLTHGVNFILHGDSNDYLGKGLSGGKIIVTPPEESTFRPEENIICGNTLLYGATSGKVFINGIVGERFCVRNSGAVAVVEGTGDHCCEYMTGGRTVVLGSVGRNFAAGMSGGIAYVLDMDNNFDYFCNMEMVELSLVESMQEQKELKKLIEEHLKNTGSKLAEKILSNWDVYIEKFIQVTPIEYKKVLQEERLKELNQRIANVERDY